MYPAHTASFHDESNFVPLACIDGQDETFIFPLREYLEAHNCRVILDNTHMHAVTYHIVAGDIRFVKHNLASSHNSAMRTLVIVIGSSLSDAQSITSLAYKIVVVSPVIFTDEDVEEIFSFFFTGIDEILDKRRTSHVPEKKVIEPIGDGTEKQDKLRIGSIINDVFGPSQHKLVKKRKTSRVVGKIFLFIVVFSILVFWYFASLVGSVGSFRFAAQQLKAGDLQKTTRLVQFGGYWLSQGKVSFGILRLPLAFLGLTKTVRGQERLLSFLGDIQSAFGETQEIIFRGRQVSRLVLDQDTKDRQSPAAPLEQLQLSIISLLGSLGLAQAQLTSLLADESFPFFIPSVRKEAEGVTRHVATMRNSLSYAESFLALYPRLAGFSEVKTYLVLLQNSAELRPTGGFIGSIGKLTFEEGKMSNFHLQDVYAVDGQLKGHVDPPLPIAELLGQEHWYLRDSNWDPDFLLSSQKAAWFYQKETGEQVDGVIGLSLSLVEDVLRVTGPVMLSDYNDQITADNFLGKSIFYTKSDFFPGSTAKSDFLGTLARTLLLKLTTDDTLDMPKLFTAIVGGISRRDIQFMFADPKLQQLVEHFGWAGRVLQGLGCDGVQVSTCLFDPIVVNEANVSVSKVNAFIRHASVRDIVVSADGDISETMTLAITNTAQDNQPGVGGTYRTYIRFFIPTDATIGGVTLDGVPVAFRPVNTAFPAVAYVEQVEAPPVSQGVGVAIDVPVGSIRRIGISYKRSVKLPVSENEFVFELMQHKQAGVGDIQQKTTIHYPDVWEARDESARGGEHIANKGQLEYNTIVLQDLRYRVRFIK